MDSLMSRLKSRIRQKPSGCWEWTGYRDSAGYGRFTVRGTPRLAHRLMFEAYFGSAPKLLRHLCNTPACTNPRHLAPGTHAENSQDARRAGRLGGFVKPRLTPQAVEEARQRLTSGETQASVARHLNVSKSTIHLLAKGKTWRGELYVG